MRTNMADWSPQQLKVESYALTFRREGRISIWKEVKCCTSWRYYAKTHRVVVPLWVRKAHSRDTVHTHGTIRLSRIFIRPEFSSEVNRSTLHACKKMLIKKPRRFQAALSIFPAPPSSTTRHPFQGGPSARRKLWGRKASDRSAEGAQRQRRSLARITTTDARCPNWRTPSGELQPFGVCTVAVTSAIWTATTSPTWSIIRGRRAPTLAPLPCGLAASVTPDGTRERELPGPDHKRCPHSVCPRGTRPAIVHRLLQLGIQTIPPD